MNAGVFLSTNNGSSWTAVNTGLTNHNVLSLAISGSSIFAGTMNAGVFLSTNNGSSWTAVNTGLTGTWITALAISGPNIFAGTYYDGVFLSTNNGSNWTAVNTGLTDTIVNVLAISGSNIFAGTVDGVFLSSNNGSNWAAMNTGLRDTNVTALAISGDTLFAGTAGAGVWKQFLSVLTGIKEINNNESSIAVYPNPAINNLTIESPQKAVIEITNIQGQLIKTIVASSCKTNVDVSALPSGVYVVEVKTEKGIAVKKFIKE
jgi:photosystem II stability/assembly factor-like uncharacterized protein